MRFDIVTIFPEFFDGPLDYGILRRARATGLVEVHVEDLRDYTHDRHRTVDDRPFGGGEGMVLKPEPLFEAVETIVGVKPVSSLSKKPAKVSTAANTSVVLLSASGKMFTEQVARRLSKLERVVLICGRYEGVDERVAEHLATDEISIGDFVLSGGELPAAVIVDAVTRLLPGALGNGASSVRESFSVENLDAAMEADGDGGKSGASSSKKRKEKIVGAEFSEWLRSVAISANAEGERGGILDCPHYTRPAAFRDWAIPEILNGGNHEEIRIWRRRAALAKTLQNRPELLARAGLTNEELVWLEEFHASAKNHKTAKTSK
jgi:tRNA (guanine37-N1)-methyltransferase